MRPFLMILSGFVLTIGTFAAGAVAATALLAASPVETKSLTADATGLWTNKPVRISKAGDKGEKDQETRQVAAAADLPGADEALGDALPVEAGVDEMETASISQETQPAADPAALAAHMRWCSQRYRSYSPDTNSYRPYSGGTKPCVSPYLDAADVRGASPQAEDAVNYVASLQTEPDRADAGQALASGGLSAAHIQACAQRYRSYRVEDNSYQPYGGGPRRQCQ